MNKNNIPCICKHRKSTHNYKDRIKKKVLDEYKTAKRKYRHSLEWYLNTAERILTEDACGATNCDCEYYNRDNLKYLESLSNGLN